MTLNDVDRPPVGIVEGVGDHDRLEQHGAPGLGHRLTDLEIAVEEIVSNCLDNR